MRRWRGGHVKEEGGRSCPDSIVEGGAENVQGREKGGRGEERERGNRKVKGILININMEKPHSPEEKMTFLELTSSLTSCWSH